MSKKKLPSDDHSPPSFSPRSSDTMPCSFAMELLTQEHHPSLGRSITLDVTQAILLTHQPLAKKECICGTISSLISWLLNPAPRLDVIQKPRKSLFFDQQELAAQSAQSVSSVNSCFGKLSLVAPLAAQSAASVVQAGTKEITTKLYTESIQDLLAPEKINIPIHEDPKTGEA
ncbi:hypothetical protein DVH24_021641 [Malus domestica]|uniref:Uncharacterized protein n=1 Tax=Malus domestica TaxID=3750 RepID=A0A498JVC2_MALDO|nr:hypothetical protein DVH24_021641 [Malus domestica]